MSEFSSYSVCNQVGWDGQCSFLNLSGWNGSTNKKYSNLFDLVSLACSSSQTYMLDLNLPTDNQLHPELQCIILQKHWIWWWRLKKKLYIAWIFSWRSYLLKFQQHFLMMIQHHWDNCKGKTIKPKWNALLQSSLNFLPLLGQKE